MSQARLVLDFTNQLAARMDLNAGVCEFICRLLDLAAKNKGSFTRQDLRYFTLTLDFIRNRAAEAGAGSHATGLIAFVKQLQA